MGALVLGFWIKFSKSFGMGRVAIRRYTRRALSRLHDSMAAETWMGICQGFCLCFQRIPENTSV
jgi:hypothetical protein